MLINVCGTLLEIEKKTTAIVKFGPITETDGMRPAEYFQVTIDPEKISPDEKFIRLGTENGDELVGWQRIAALSVVCILGEWEDPDIPPVFNYGAPSGKITMDA